MREICVSKLIGLALKLEGNLPLLLCFTLYLRAISKYKLPPGGGGAYIWRGDLTEGFLRYESEGLIFGILRYSQSPCVLYKSVQLKAPGKFFFYLSLLSIFFSLNQHISSTQPTCI